MSGFSIEAQVKASDRDRWLSSRFVADQTLRSDLLGLYGFEAELLTIPARVTQPMLAEMRYVWWSEQLDAVFEGRVRKGHPVLEALTDIVLRHRLERLHFDALINAHIGRIHGEPHDIDAFYVGPMQLAVGLLVGPGHEDKVRTAGRMWGLTQVGRKDEALALRRQVNRDIRGLPTQGFPAIAHAALVEPSQGEGIRRLRLIWAVLKGRL
jgi:phytoene synthase